MQVPSSVARRVRDPARVRGSKRSQQQWLELGESTALGFCPALNTLITPLLRGLWEVVSRRSCFAQDHLDVQTWHV